MPSARARASRAPILVPPPSPRLAPLRTLLVLAALGAGCGDDDSPGGPDGAVADASVSDSGGRRDGGGRDGGRRDGAAPEDDGGGRDASTPPAIGCPALPAPAGEVVRVTPARADELVGLVRDAAPGTTFLLEDGTYRFSGTDEGNRRLQLRARGVSLRSASDDASAVVIDGEYRTLEMITITAPDVTVAHVTVTRAVDHPIHVTPPGGGPNVTGTLLYGLRVVDGGEQFVKINSNGARDAWTDDGRVECSSFLMTDEGRTHVERAIGGCYTGGIDAHSARGWIVRNNRFEDIYCAGEGLAEHAIHFWSASRDTLIENNLILDCARGIGLGLVESGATRAYADDPYPGVGYVGHYDGIVRNNVIFAEVPWYDTGIELDQARGARVLHNTVHSTAGATGFFSSIDYRFANTQVEIRNNLTQRITQRNGATGTVESNLEDTPSSLFADVGARDFHLAAGASAAIDRGTVTPGAGLDMDGQPHDLGAAPDLGADERAP